MVYYLNLFLADYIPLNSIVFKICMKDIPGFTLMGLFGAGMLLFGYSMEIAERALLRDETSFKD